MSKGDENSIAVCSGKSGKWTKNTIVFMTTCLVLRYIGNIITLVVGATNVENCPMEIFLPILLTGSAENFSNCRIFFILKIIAFGAICLLVESLLIFVYKKYHSFDKTSKIRPVLHYTSVFGVFLEMSLAMAIMIVFLSYLHPEFDDVEADNYCDVVVYALGGVVMVQGVLTMVGLFFYICCTFWLFVCDDEENGGD